MELLEPKLKTGRSADNYIDGDPIPPTVDDVLGLVDYLVTTVGVNVVKHQQARVFKPSHLLGNIITMTFEQPVVTDIVDWIP